MVTLIVQSLMAILLQNPAREAEILARVAEFGDAFMAADADKLSDMLTDDYVHSGPTGRVRTKQEWLSWIATRRDAMDSGAFRFDTYENDEFIVRIHGDTAIVSARNRATGLRDGQPFSFRIRFTNVWVKQEGQWRRAAFHDSRISAP